MNLLEICNGVSMATTLSLAVSYPTLAAAPHMIINGYKNVLAVSVETDYSYPLAQHVREYLKDPSKFTIAIAAVAESGELLQLQRIDERWENGISILGRESEEPSGKKGLIEEEKVDSFNIPNYMSSPAEVKYIVEKEGSFTINQLETTRVHWNNASNDDENNINGGYNVSKCMRAVAEPLLVSQFGPKFMDLVFQKYEEIISDCMARETTEFINVTVSLTKKN
ncbi:hypothetical protein HAX54_043498 [Datura stramonium]|uniref:Uncharacterized protein n=1 Tax=Datura stramonium TaxID=4076 RepID=A0ABS8SN65_DATST|nr:hypothetical protein [Datura stramonium]